MKAFIALAGVFVLLVVAISFTRNPALSLWHAATTPHYLAGPCPGAVPSC
jgi:hypothetical protein